MRIPVQTEKISARITPEQMDAINRIAESIGATSTDVVRHSIELGLRDLAAGNPMPGFPPFRMGRAPVHERVNDL